MPARSVFASLLLIIAGCTVVPVVDLYNDSGTVVRVMVGPDTHVLPPATTESFDYPSQSWGEVTVCANQRLFRYIIPFPPNDYYHGVAFLFVRSHIRVQIAPDWRLWILKRGESFPVRDPQGQPAPFPLVPEELGSCEE